MTHTAADVYIHPTALVHTSSIGEGTRIWAFCNILDGVTIGRHCQICDRVFIEPSAVLGDHVTIKCGVSIWDGITLGNGVFVGPEVAFTNDRMPRSKRQVPHPKTFVDDYASLGAASVILPGLTIGKYAMVGAGSVVTKDVPPHALVIGNPARRVGWVCVCGEKLDVQKSACACGRRYAMNDSPQLIEGNPEPWT
jgi:acetyltransferase-like isoleucine patch superfamily enzyme